MSPQSGARTLRKVDLEERFRDYADSDAVVCAIAVVWPVNTLIGAWEAMRFDFGRANEGRAAK